MITTKAAGTRRVAITHVVAVVALGCMVASCTEPARPSNPDSPPSLPAFARTGGSSVTITDLGTLSNHSSAQDINDAGMIVGTSQAKSSEDYRDLAWVWTPTTPGASTGTMRALATLAGGCCSQVYAVNGVHSAGTAKDASGAWRYVFWTTAGEISERSTTSGPECGVKGMNDGGQLVGFTSVDGVTHACIWTPSAPNGTAGTTRVLPLPDGASSACGAGLNNRGDVVGWITLAASGDQHAYVWGADGTSLDLGVLPGGRFAAAQDINDQGEVVGSSYANIDGKLGWRAFLWTPQRGMQDLGAIGPWSGANDITNVVNGMSHVVGWASPATSKPGEHNAALWMIAHGADGRVTDVSLRDLGRPNASLRATAYALGNIGGVIQAVGVRVASSLINKATLWTVKVP